MTDRPFISLSIVSHGDAGKIKELLSSIQEHEPDTKRFQIILTDNLGDNLPEFDPVSWASLQILRNKKQQGFAYNHNHAFELAQGEYFAVLNPDLVFERAVFDKLLATLHSYNADLIAPQIMDINGVIQDSFRPLPSPVKLIRRRLPGYRFEMPKPDTNGLFHPDWIAAMFWLMPVSTYRALRGMDEKFTLYFEDVDFCTRARLQGMKIVVDTNLQVIHDGQRSSRRNIHYLLLHMKSAFQFFTSPKYRQARQKKSTPCRY